MKKLISNIWRYKHVSRLSQTFHQIHITPLSHNMRTPCHSHFGMITHSRTYATIKRPVVIGGSNIDIVATAREDIVIDGRMLNGTISQCRGGVGRNIADALARLHVEPLLITAVGNDEMGQFLMSGSKHMDTRGFRSCSHDSGCCCVIVDNTGECKFIVGNMNIHANISLEWIQKFEQDIANASFLVFDGNIKPDAISYILKICNSYSIPVWFEPTDIAVCDVILSTEWSSITHMSPNFNELKHMSSVLTGRDLSSMNPTSLEEMINESIALSKNFPSSTVLMVTLGRHGMLLILGEDIQYYKALPVDTIVNVSGAGDCAVAGYIAAQLSNRNATERVSAALSCAQQSLMSTTPVPSEMCLDFVEVQPTILGINTS